jgi:nicotinate phosphoribosyltransferase
LIIYIPKILFSNDFLDFLGHLRFTGDINAIEEGRIFFKDEPILELTAPIIQGQLVETFIINAINFGVSLLQKLPGVFTLLREKT